MNKALPVQLVSHKSMSVRLRLPVHVVMPSLGLCNGHDEAPVLHTFQADQAPREFFNLFRFSVDNQHFKTGIVVKMRVTRRDHKFVIGMLKFGELLSYSIGMMVVNERDSANYRRTGFSRLLGDQTVSDQISKGFGSVCVADPGNQLIEAFEKVGVQCHPNPAENAHLILLDDEPILRENRRIDAKGALPIRSTISKFVVVL